ncbi:steroid receptor RNA activator 1 isoform X2 [Megachile rotundata]|uniref:steroid receptor RNA activator 1 isoform X2 n=1 Tax=Megachile rotundata TaxID=143995 RepID=UPI000614F663|nr:PREDICTED: steroid receptor RNA activator 1-like isoform X2 [Megachile rotundata]
MKLAEIRDLYCCHRKNSKELSLTMNEQETNQNLSTQKVLLPGHDPGWNDPPKWAYSGAQSSVTPTKRVLNKRVAFPLASTKANDKEPLSETKTLNMPPLVQSSSNLPPASNKVVDVDISDIKIDKEKTLSNVLENLDTVINEHILEKNRVEEVRKRLDVLKSMWLEDKLNNVIYKNILDLSAALREGDIQKADQIHVSLMMQHASLCSSWIPGIRHIILELKTKTDTSSAIQS